MWLLVIRQRTKTVLQWQVVFWVIDEVCFFSQVMFMLSVNSKDQRCFIQRKVKNNSLDKAINATYSFCHFLSDSCFDE